MMLNTFNKLLSHNENGYIDLQNIMTTKQKKNPRIKRTLLRKLLPLSGETNFSMSTTSILGCKYLEATRKPQTNTGYNIDSEE